MHSFFSFLFYTLDPGGPENDFGIKYNVANGGPAPESVTNEIYSIIKSQSSLLIDPSLKNVVDLATIGSNTYPGGLTVEIIDSVNDYVVLMKEIFDFSIIKTFLADGNFSILFDSMHGVTGPYATRILVEELGLPSSAVMNGIPLEDFGGGHPDPNLTYAHELVDAVEKNKINFGAASDGDGDRNMVINFFSPGFYRFLSSHSSFIIIRLLVLGAYLSIHPTRWPLSPETVT